MRAATARLLAMAAILLLFVVALPLPVRGATTTVVSGSLRCRCRSRASCTIGSTLTLRSTDLGGQTITIDVSWLLDQLPKLEQDDWLSFEVEILTDGTVRPTSQVPTTDGTINTGQTMMTTTPRQVSRHRQLLRA